MHHISDVRPAPAFEDVMSRKKHLGLICKKLKPIYDGLVIVLAIISIVFVVLDMSSTVIFDGTAFGVIDTAILIFFAVDYVARFVIASKKWKFVRTHIFDLLAIMPFDMFFSIFRIARIARLARALRFIKAFKAIAFMGRLSARVKGFLKTNGLLYYFYFLAAIILLGAAGIYVAEDQINSFEDAIWWAVVTVSTVGYGDIAPTSAVGRIIAVVLMFFGIGFVSMLTGSIVTFFAKGRKDNVKESMDEDIPPEIVEKVREYQEYLLSRHNEESTSAKV